ncbi:MAG: dTDP-4-dehydrorhamnose reductase [Fervidicoccaceae archaeon]
MKVLVTGATGLLGYWLIDVLALSGYDVYATYHEKVPLSKNVSWVKLNLEDMQSIAKTISEIKPDIVIHSAAYTDVDGCEINKEKAYMINYIGTEAVARASRDVNYFIYISTDYVFGGEKGLYKEEDAPAPVNYYGLTKLLGEVAVKNILPDRSVVVRVSGLYGYSPTGKKNFGVIALEKLLKREPIEAFVDQWLSPTYVRFLAMAITKLIEKKPVGIIHVAGERLSRYDFALKLADILGVERELVRPITMDSVKLIALRPRDSSLDTSKAMELGLSMPPLTDCLKDMIYIYKKFMEA